MYDSTDEDVLVTCPPRGWEATHRWLTLAEIFMIYELHAHAPLSFYQEPMLTPSEKERKKENIEVQKTFFAINTL